MKKLKLLSFVFAGLAFVTMVGCSKGTTGPKGDTGATGAAGPDSVIHSAWVTLAMTIEGTQANSSGGTDTFYTQSITAPAITQRILDSGVVLSYMSFVDNNGATNVVSAASFFNPEIFLVGQISLNSIDVDWSGYSYRYVVIPGSLIAGNSILKGLTKAQLKAADYSTIVKALGISDTKTSN